MNGVSSYQINCEDQTNIDPDLEELGTSAETLSITYDGRPGPVSGIQIKNLLLLIPTFGVYRFWATSRLRRYFWSSIKFNDSRLEYTGRGMELFLGLIVVLLVLVPVAVGFGFLFNFLLIDLPVLAFTLYFLFLLGLVFLGYVGTYLRHRYIMSRTRWRGIRFALKGSPWRYAAYGLGQMALILITLSIYTPYATMNLTKRLWENTFFGNQPIGFDRKVTGLMQRFLPIFGSYLFGYLILAGLVYALEVSSHPEPIAIVTLVFTFLWWASFFWFIAVYQGRVYKNVVEGFRFHNLKFRSAYRGSYLFKAYLIAGLIVMPVFLVTFIAAAAYIDLTSGFIDYEALFSGELDLGPLELISAIAPFVLAGLITYLAVLFVAPVVIQHRLFRDLASTATISGQYDPEMISQSDQKLDGRGEGLATAIDVGGF